MIFRLLTISLLLAGFCAAPLQAQTDIPVLSGDRLVYDMGDMLSDSDEAALNSKLVGYDDSTSTQIAVVTIATLNGYEVGDFAVRLGQKNGIGRDGKDNGALILVAREERKISIQVGYGLEPVIPDGVAGTIIRQYLTPRFKEGKYYEGLDAATTVIMQLAAGEFTADDLPQDDFFRWMPFIIILIIAFVLFTIYKNRRNFGEGYSGRGHTPWIGGGFGGFGGGFGGGGRSFGGGGGFGGFGGGGFGGGGASGGW